MLERFLYGYNTFFCILQLSVPIKLFAFDCVKSVRIWSYSGPHFPAFCRIRTEYGEILVSLRRQSECGKITMWLLR